MNEFFGFSFWQNVAAAAAYTFLYVLVAGLFSWARSRWNALRFTQENFIATTLVMWLCANVLFLLAALFSPGQFPAHSVILFAFLTILPLLYTSLTFLRRYWAIGLVGCDASISRGITFEESLRLCSNQLDFLGVGAFKLTQSEEFEKAVYRCNNPNRPIRLLLARPDGDALRIFAEQAKNRAGAYQERVTESLRMIAQLRNGLHRNIEVRLYQSDDRHLMPLFRLFFINESICLCSYTVFGEGDGSQLPQLHLRKYGDRRETDSFYHGFRGYFERLWKDSEVWDFTSYLRM